MDMIERYVYAVTKSLPEKQRDDIQKELRTLIDDMIEQNQEPISYSSKVHKVLLELGDPEVLANNYRGSKRYLIGPQYYDKYILIMKIVFGAVFIGVSIAVLIESIFLSEQSILDIMADYTSAIFSGLLQAFAWTTIAFMIAELNSKNAVKNASEKNKWSPQQLPMIPEKKAKISLSDPIFSILFITAFITLILSAPKLFAIYINNSNGVTVIPIFNLEAMQGYKVLFVCIFILAILKEVLKIYYRRWTLKLSILCSGLSIVATGLILFIFMNNNIWNQNFANEIMRHMNLSFNFTDLWVKIKNGSIIVVILFSIIEVVTTLYKGIKYNIAKSLT